ncbi:hypothetical protein AWRI1631_121200 [Saccharomyces cerevisiae AWRI1631]|uniref:Uncharacterized protein n=1 Tax=Saccharomyces cerevisiae (strain AWRI1631) TaxID=545124 RepID=B5VN08_YEAS6|nr:hypothetical protein AWRI1631_121200 [Saccharomyces cerevisiae AWRI1631]
MLFSKEPFLDKNLTKAPSSLTSPASLFFKYSGLSKLVKPHS